MPQCMPVEQTNGELRLPVKRFTDRGTRFSASELGTRVNTIRGRV